MALSAKRGVECKIWRWVENVVELRVKGDCAVEKWKESILSGLNTLEAHSLQLHTLARFIDWPRVVLYLDPHNVSFFS